MNTSRPESINAASPATDDMERAKRRGRKWNVSVVGARQLTPRMRRVYLTGAELQEFACRPAQEVVLFLPGGEAEVKRHYTISDFDHATRMLSVDIVLHGASPGGRWAETAVAGDPLVIAGPRGRIALDESADWHLLVGDETALPAIASMLRSVAPGKAAFAFIEIAAADEQQALQVPAGGHLQWLVRGESTIGHGGLLIDAVAAFRLPPGRGHAYVMGETHTAKTIKDSLRDRGLARDQLSAEGYWRHGRIGGHDHLDD